VGRGSGSGHGTTAGKGSKGQKARSGGQIPLKFEGGQLPLVKRLPHKRGFKNVFRREYAPINLHRLNRFSPDTEVNPQRLSEAGIIESANHLVKILGDGDLRQPLTVVAHRFSASAKAKIEAAGGKVVQLEA
jgi:large subunit ribosomal protein L15